MSMITTISTWIIPFIILIVLIAGTIKKVPTYETFVEGGKEGIQMAISLLPFLLGMIVAISIFRASGAMEGLVALISPVLQIMGIPSDIVPLAAVRPISGTAALAVTTDLIKEFGPDSFIGKLASTMQGSTDTTLYILTVYFGAVGIKKMGDALKVGLLADLIGIIASITICTYFFGF
ncbi:spore maturation protein [Salinibacillus xinjiangensis]|uniref:Spore maturation protein n=1 Tax=Salinibacillus xinjiangensis TaxID=1229268 RepID=A0A6G1X6E3_9BACI|nr:spore maturation protein [Salinibacillus xinjiangensis]MRG86450.1 spore maturation protein [Salinibacillus xinjiangensis]